jgi:hypothetical protein
MKRAFAISDSSRTLMRRKLLLSAALLLLDAVFKGATNAPAPR